MNDDQKEKLADWFHSCCQRTDNGYLPDVWLEELEVIVEGIRNEALEEAAALFETHDYFKKMIRKLKQ